MAFVFVTVNAANDILDYGRIIAHIDNLLSCLIIFNVGLKNAIQDLVGRQVILV